MSRRVLGAALLFTVIGWGMTAVLSTRPADGEEPPSAKGHIAQSWTFQQHVRPLLKKNCLRCHNAETMESGIRLDQLDGSLAQQRLFLWRDMLRQIEDESMPPDGEPQPSADERKALAAWIKRAIEKARSRHAEKNGSVRRLTVAQYRNTLRDLLGIQEDLTGILPPDGISKEGFTNNGETMSLSPLLVEAYFNIAEKALDLCIVNEREQPVIQSFRMELGENINPTPCPDELILGANSMLLRNQDFQVTELQPDKPFAYRPFAMRKSFRFIEGYQGNDTVRGWREFNSIYHAVFACMRGTLGYPRGHAYQCVPEGLLLRPAIPSSELFGESSTYGPHSNFKVSLRELPQQGNFRVVVDAARYDDGLLLNPSTDTPIESPEDDAITADLSTTPSPNIAIATAGIYQIDVDYVPSEKPAMLSLQLGDRHFPGTLPQQKPSTEATEEKPSARNVAFLLVRLGAGTLDLKAQVTEQSQLRMMRFHRIDEQSRQAQRFVAFERRSPILGVHVGLRRDCGSTLARVGEPQAVTAKESRRFVFEGAINNFPSPDVEEGNPNYLAGFREIGVRSEFTDGRAMPRLRIRSVEFEGPYYETWPPATHRNIFVQSTNRDDPPTYAREVILKFASRAFRRPVTDAELTSLHNVWKTSFDETKDFQQSIKHALIVVLTSPQFLFLVEESAGPEAEDLDEYELASKLSYFLWNSAPDERLIERAAAKTLRRSLDIEIDRMIADPRFRQFTQQFASQWLSLDKFDVLEVDRKRYPQLTRDTRAQLREEPVQTVLHLIRKNLPLRRLIQSDFIVANDVVAHYYGIADRSESGFQFLPVQHESENLGGLLTQAGILAGLSDGRESNPVKRGAWFARKIIAEPPDDPPPNVPELMEDDGEQLTLRQRLERHRNQKGCANCHSGIDPWGIAFEEFNAGGRYRTGDVHDPRSTLPDGTEIENLNELKAYLIQDRLDRVAFSFMKHLAVYATGRSLNFQDVVFLEQEGVKLKSHDYRMRDMIRFIIHSDLFMKK